MAEQTAVEWLVKEIESLITIETFQRWKVLKEQAKQMEKEQLDNARPQIVSNCVIKEISDEEMEKLSELEYPYDELVNTELKGLIVSAERAAWIEGIKWHREQLKKK